MKLATTTSDLYGFFYTPRETVSFFRETGFRYLDYSFSDALKGDDPLMRDNWKELISDAKKTADENGFRFLQAHAPSYNPLNPFSDPEKGKEAMKRAILACGMLGIEHMVTHMGFSDAFPYPQGERENFQKNALFFREFIPLLEENNVKLCMENSCQANMNGKYFCMTAKELKSFVLYLDSPVFCAAWDIGHAHVEGINTRDAMVELGDLLCALHIHDNNGLKDMHLPPFTGNFDFSLLRRGIADSHFSGAFVLEADRFAEYQNNLPLSVKKASLVYLYRLGKNLLQDWGLWEE